MATINSSIISDLAAGDLSRHRHQSIVGGNVGYLLWLLQGYLLVDRGARDQPRPSRRHHGSVRIYNLGFAVFLLRLGVARAGSLSRRQRRALARALAPGPGSRWRDALRETRARFSSTRFPSDQRGMAMGINQVAAIGGSFIGLIAADCSRSSTGVSCSGSRFPSASWARSGATTAFAITGSARPPRSTGGATSPSRSDSRRFSSASSTASSPTCSTPWGGRRRVYSAPFSSGWCSSSRSSSSRTAWSHRFQPATLQDAGLLHGQHGRISWRRSRARPAVHAHHLAPGHLVALARLRVLRDAAVGPASTSCR